MPKEVHDYEWLAKHGKSLEWYGQQINKFKKSLDRLRKKHADIFDKEAKIKEKIEELERDACKICNMI